MTAGVDRVTVESKDGSRLHVSVFPALEPVAALVALHGRQGHAGWLEASGTGLHLAGQGILTLAYDRRGSGRSGGPRGHAAGPADFLDDLQTVRELTGRELVGRRSAGAPVHLLAHGFGALVALAYLVERRREIASIVLTTPTTHPARAAGYGLAERVRILTAPASRRYPSPVTDEALVGEGPWREWLRDDERSLRAFTASFLRAGARLSTRARAALGRLSVPMMVILAEDDRLVENDAVERSLRASYRGPLRIRRLPGEHSLDFSASQAEYRAALVGWILGGWAAP